MLPSINYCLFVNFFISFFKYEQYFLRKFYFPIKIESRSYKTTIQVKQTRHIQYSLSYQDSNAILLTAAGKFNK